MMDSVVKSAARVLEVFEYFANRRAAASVSDVCSALGYPQSSTSVLLKSLMTLGYLSYDTTTRRYVPTHRVATLGGWLEESGSRLPVLLQSLHERTRASTFGAQLNGFHVQCIESHDSNAPVGRADDQARQSVWTSAAGLALLAQSNDGQILRLLRRANSQEESTDAGVVIDDREILARVAMVRRDGIAVTDNAAGGTTELAAVAPDLGAGGTVAIGLVVSRERYLAEREQLMGALRDAVRSQSVARGSAAGSGGASTEGQVVVRNLLSPGGLTAGAI